MRLFQFMTLVGVFLGVYSCASLPERQSAEESLVILKADAVNPDYGPFLRVYELQFTGGYPDVRIPKGRDQYVCFIIRDPGVKIQAVYSFVPFTQADGNDALTKYDIEIPYHPGQAIIMDQGFVQFIKKVDTDSYLCQHLFRELEVAEKEALMDQLREKIISGYWKPKLY